LYIAESTALRVKKMESIKGEAGIAVYRKILEVMIYDAAGKVEKNGQDAINSFAAGEEAQNLITAIKALFVVKGVNVKVARRVIADKLIEDNSYKF
ncbi:MAG: acyl-CoA dehydrogenase, partial [Bacteroidia bacterium]|nr:acyl-CoA dehydrogenase [Bacteroidia bacterium]